jgi:Uncharacterised protein family (UPF0158)
VTDTPPEVMQRYRAMLLARSPEERLKMGCSMSATARILVRASVLAHDPHASPAAVRRALFLRFYGHEFPTVEQERILMRLGDDEPRPARSTKLVPVNWGDLEMALTSDPGEWTCYLDLETGEVRMVPMGGLEEDADGLPEDEIDDGLNAGRLVHVEPLGSRVEYQWMAEFAGTVRHARLRDRLEVALDGRGAFRRFKNVLLDFPAERERWFAFRDQRLHAEAREWLEEVGLEPTTVPPASR